MAGLCSAHQGYDKDCKACQVSVPMTAEELLQKVEKQYTDLSGTKVVISEKGARRQLVTDAMKEYAWIKIQEALKAASENVKINYTDLTSDSLVDQETIQDMYYHEDIEAEIDKDSILNAYPKSNIV